MPDLDHLLPGIINLPSGDVGQLVEAVRQGQVGLDGIRARTGSARMRTVCGRLLQALDTLSVDYVSGWVEGAASVATALRTEQQVDVVWTGPESDVDTARFTSQVVIGLIEQAERHLLLASYATNPDERTLESLARAAAQGVEITVLHERSEDNPNFRSGPDPFSSLPVRRLVWPEEHRPAGASLHPKFIVVDDRVALVGSANLTGRALDANIECGVLIRGGRQPKDLADHIWSLVRSGLLVATHGR